MKNNKLLLFLFLYTICILIGCSTDETPKPEAYPRINFPERKSLITFSDDTCPFIFTLPNYYIMHRKRTFFNEKTENPCWMNLECSDLNATIYLSYKMLSPDQSLQKLIDDAYKLTYKHTQKADYIEPQEIDNGHGAVGLIYYVGGDAASNFQFFITDTTKNFVRGALYFYTHPNADSLKPVVNFMIEDIEGMLNSWRWK
jgi:gliding motility-associated lipoprotein GldD